jgi:hypothetical protein
MSSSLDTRPQGRPFRRRRSTRPQPHQPVVGATTRARRVIPRRSLGDRARRLTVTPLGAVSRGLVAGAFGTLAMDALWYAGYRRGHGESDFAAWEFSSGLDSWDLVAGSLRTPRVRYGLPFALKLLPA